MKIHTLQQCGTGEDNRERQCDPTVRLTPRTLPKIGLSSIEQILDTHDVVVHNVLRLGFENGFQCLGDVLATLFLENRRYVSVEELELADARKGVDGIEVVCQIVDRAVPDTPDPIIFMLDYSSTR